MGFSDRQTRALARSVPSRNVKTRVSAGKELTYIEGWYALAQANRIFGFDGWDRETIETKCLHEREARSTYAAIYSARVRVTVRANDATVVRDGHGTGEAFGGSLGEVHDRALKAAETDATKRALATFGKAFGLALYSGDRRVPTTRATGRQLNGITPPRSAGKPVPADDLQRPVTARGTKRCEDHNLATEASFDNPSPQSQSPGMDPALRQRIEKSALTFPKPLRIRDKDHLRYVASQPCLLCEATPSDPHHVRFAQPRAMARKVGDDFTVPLCRKHHRDLHRSGTKCPSSNLIGHQAG